MSLENPVLTFRPIPENLLFIEGLHQNAFPFLSKSAVINLVITWTRLTSQRVNLQHEMTQCLHGVSLYTRGAEPQKVAHTKAKAMAGGAA